MMSIDSAVKTMGENMQENIDGTWSIARSENSKMKSFLERLKDGYLVLTGKAEAFYYESEKAQDATMKIYNSWDRHSAEHLVGKIVDFHVGNASSRWTPHELESIEDIGSPFVHSNGYGVAIRETNK